MSKEMKKAYSALWLKDMMSAWSERAFIVALALTAVTLLCLNVAAFVEIAVVAAVVWGCWCSLRLAVRFYNRRIGRLGFSEVELERLACHL